MCCCFCSKIVFKVVFRICKVWFGFVCSCCFPLVLMICSRILCFLVFYVYFTSAVRQMRVVWRRTGILIFRWNFEEIDQ